MIFFVLFCLTTVLTFLIRKLALQKNIIDSPNARSSHTLPTPRGGGLAIVIIWFGILTYFYFKKDIEHNLFYALLSGVVLAVVSLVDDIINLSPKIRLLAQILTALLALYFLKGFQLFQIESQILFWIFTICAFIGIIWFINLYNFLDGIDAYASQEAILVLLGFAILIPSHNIFIALIVIILGFLVWNWPQAKIFMGDVGSTQLGFILVVFAIYYHNKEQVNIVNWLILTSVFWFDATYTLFMRWKNKEQLSKAHKKHAYQRLVQAGWLHQKISVYAILLNILLVGITYFNHVVLNSSIVTLIVVVGFLLFLLRRIDKLYPFSKGY